MTKVCVVGLGFVGIPLTHAFDSVGYDVVGYDIDEERITELQRGIDPTQETDNRVLQESDVTFTSDPEKMRDFDYAIVTVPTPVDDWNRPDMTAAVSAAEIVGQVLRPGGTVVLESTVYPGATRKEFIPALEDASGLEAGTDFSVGYSPERIAPGHDRLSNIKGTNKIVSGLDQETLVDLLQIYDSILDAAVHPAPTIETAEASKCLENIQRDVNIALINEFFMGCQEADVELSPSAVLEAANTKPHFHDYRPGLVGGHCIPIDPHFMIETFQQGGFHPRIIEESRRRNEDFPKFLAEHVVKQISQASPKQRQRGIRSETDGGVDMHPPDAEKYRVLIHGFAYKPNVKDARNEALKSLIEELKTYRVTVAGHDSLIENSEIEGTFGVEPIDDAQFREFDAIIVTTLHDDSLTSEIEELASSEEPPFVLDLTGHIKTSKALTFEG